MSEHKTKITYDLSMRHVNAHGSLSHCKKAEITLGDVIAGHVDTFKPAELLMAALATCIIKGIDRVTSTLGFELRGVEVLFVGVCQAKPPKMEFIDYEILVDSDENNHRLELLHDNVKKYSTIFNTIAPGTELKGVLRRDIRTY